MKFNYLLIPLITFLVALSGGWATDQGMAWYQTINLPAWTPPGSVIGTVWTFLFVLATISALIIYNLVPKGAKRRRIMWAFVANALLNFGWSFVFFFGGQISWALAELVVLAISIIVLLVLIWPRSKAAAILLMPYLAWVCFAGYLNYSIWLLNR